MPVAIQMLVGVRPAQHERLQRALLEAGLIDQLVQPLDLRAPVQALHLPSEDALLRLSAALRLHDLEPGAPRRFWAPPPRSWPPASCW